MDAIKKVLEKWQNDYKEVVRILDPNKGYTIIENCNWVVVNKITDKESERIYTIGAKWNEELQKDCANVVIDASFPTQFTEKEAKSLLNWEASNGRGKIEWEMIDKISFYQYKKEQLQRLIESVEEIIKLRDEGN